LGRKTRKKSAKPSGQQRPDSSPTRRTDAIGEQSAAQSLRLRFGPPLLIIAAVLLCYANTLDNAFVHDDRVEILGNPSIQDLSHLSNLVSSPAWAFSSTKDQRVSSNYYRPLQYVTYALLYRLNGPSPWVFHLWKLILHAGVCLLFYALLARAWKKPALGLTSALIYAVHPANTEAVSWISGITDVMCALFFLMSFWFYVEFRKTSSLTRLVAVHLCFFGGLLSKETMVTFVPVMIAYDWLSNRRPPALGHCLKVYGPLLIGFAVYLGLRIHAIGGFTEPTQIRYTLLNPFQMGLNQLDLLARYFGTFFFPASLNAYRLFDPVLSFSDARVAMSACLLGTIAMVAAFAYRRSSAELRPLLQLGLAWFILTLSPVLVFLKQIGENVMAERYLYLPSLGLTLAVCISVQPLKEILGKPWMVASFVVLLSLLARQTFRRNHVWQDEITFYEETVRASPRVAGIFNNLGAAYLDRGRNKEATSAFEQSVAIQPTVSALRNLGRVYAGALRINDAVRVYEQAAKLFPADGEIYAGLGEIYLFQRDYAKASANFEKALNALPNNLRICLNLGDTYLLERRYREAYQTFQKALTLSPKGGDYRARRGMSTAQAFIEEQSNSAPK
jgi:tetratricopeptide (TPR) repeat protein